MVGAAGFEPTTPCSQSRCSTRLSYAPNVSWIVRLSLTHCPSRFKLLRAGAPVACPRNRPRRGQGMTMQAAGHRVAARTTQIPHAAAAGEPMAPFLRTDRLRAARLGFRSPSEAMPGPRDAPGDATTRGLGTRRAKIPGGHCTGLLSATQPPACSANLRDYERPLPAAGTRRSRAMTLKTFPARR